MTTPEADTRAEAEAILAQIAASSDAEIDLAEGALALAAFERPQVPFARYRAHLAELAEEVAKDGARDLEEGGERAALLARVLFGRYGYEGDRLTYDDLQNANLIRVIDRRKGLPVALGILSDSCRARPRLDDGRPQFPRPFPGPAQTLVSSG